MKHRWAIVQTAVFLLFIGGFFALHLLLPDSSFSQQENRVLQGLPRFTFSALFSGRYTANLESYCNDQFPWRDRWITMKAASELVSGKSGNNGVCLCADEILLEPWTGADAAGLEERMEAVNALTDTAGVPVTLALIPNAAELWRHLLPAGVPNDSQADYIRGAYGRSHAPTADVYAALDAHKNEPIFYRTDHHWTTLGAYYGYTALAEALELEPVPLESYTETVVTREFYGTAYSSSGFSWVAPDSISAFVSPAGVTVTNYPSGQPVDGSVYDASRLETKDKYAYFYGGNTPLLHVNTGHEGPRLLILRDSYMDSLSPFLFPHFSEITLLDLRYYQAGLHAFLEEHDFDRILVCYGVKSFAEDPRILTMAE